MAKKRKDSVSFNGHLWMTDLNLNSCSLSAQGLWIEILCWMWQLRTEELSGRRIELQRLVGIFNAEFNDRLAELEQNGVCTIKHHKDGELTIYAGKWANQTRTRNRSKKTKSAIVFKRQGGHL